MRGAVLMCEGLQDIEYAEEHKYMIWDRRNFPEPERMQEKLADRGRKVCSSFCSSAPSS